MNLTKVFFLLGKMETTCHLKQQISGKIFRLVFNLKIIEKYINGIKRQETLKGINLIVHLHQDTISSRCC